MSLYDGFFDAMPVLDESGNETGEYDRAYASGDFVDYFNAFIGSGVCVHNNPDSFLVRLEGGAAVVSPGYLFIDGYWLKNDADYTLTLTGTGSVAVAAHLNSGARMIELLEQGVSTASAGTLILAIVNTSAGTVEDTRHNIQLCGVIDSAGALSKKVAWAVDYIDKEIDAKLAAAEADIEAQSRALDAKIAEVQETVDRIAPPPVGTIQYTASQNVGPEWLKCDGSFINEADYPELVAALGKLTPSGDKFQLLSNGEIPGQISNGTVCNGRMWVFSRSSRKLYGVDLAGTQPVKEIALSGDEYFDGWLAPSVDRPIALSIIPVLSQPGTYKLCLAQFVGNEFSLYDQADETKIQESLGPSKFLLYWADFSGEEESISVARPFSTITLSFDGTVFGTLGSAIPYVVSRLQAGTETFYCIPCGGDTSATTGTPSRKAAYLSWTANGAASLNGFTFATGNTITPARQILAFNKKNKNELVYIYQTNNNQQTTINSIPDGYFNREGVSGSIDSSVSPVRTNTLYGGNDFVVVNAAPDVTKEAVLSRNNLGAVRTVEFTNLSLPSAKRIFPDAGAYLWGKAIYMLFVGTGLIFSRSLTKGSFGYLDTTGVLGTITQFGYLDYSEDEGTLYLIGQDSANRVKVAKIVLNTLYDYANDGAWLPTLASDGVPAYIRAKETA